MSEVNHSRQLWAVREIKRTCGDGPRDILGVVGDKSDIVRLTKYVLAGFWSSAPGPMEILPS